MGYYEFPHTRNYDTDLGYLIKRYFELSTDFESLEKNFNDLKAWCLAQLNSEALKTLVANKLDEWLQDGTLASLINNALLHVTTYDTVVEMLTHSGIEVGSKIYCTGADNINDGKGGHFRIRTRLSTDVIDNYNLYLIDGGIKVAERIYDRILKEANTVAEKCLFGMVWSSESDFSAYPYVITDLDSSEAYKVSETASFVARDNDTIYFNGLWYDIAKVWEQTNILNIRTSKDLVNWTNHYCTLDLGNRVNLWASDFFVYNNEIYIVGSVQVAHNNSYCNTYIAKFNQNSFTIGTPTWYTLDGSNYIDPDILYYNDKFYLVIKCETTDTQHNSGTILLWESDTFIPNDWRYVRTLPFVDVEAPQLIRYKNKYCLFVDSYTNTYTQGMTYAYSDDLITWTDLKSILTFNGSIIRHTCFRTIDNDIALSTMISVSLNTITNRAVGKYQERVGNILEFNNIYPRNVDIESIFTPTNLDRLQPDINITINLTNFNESTYTIPALYSLSGVEDTLINGVLTKKSNYVSIPANISISIESTFDEITRYIINIQSLGNAGNNYTGNKISWPNLSWSSSWSSTLNDVFFDDGGTNVYMNLPTASYPSIESVQNAIATKPLNIAYILKTQEVTKNIPYKLHGLKGTCSIKPSLPSVWFTYKIYDELTSGIQNL